MNGVSENADVSKSFTPPDSELLEPKQFTEEDVIGTVNGEMDDAKSQSDIAPETRSDGDDVVEAGDGRTSSGLSMILENYNDADEDEGDEVS